MSDITKKILSLEPENTLTSKPIKKSIIHSITTADKPAPISSGGHASDIPSLSHDPSKPTSFPDFISRKESAAQTTANQAVKETAVRPINSTAYSAQPPKMGWIVWTGIALTIIWIGASAAVYFGLFQPAINTLNPAALSGLILAILLPAVLITLLWITWRRLAQMSHEVGRVAHAAQILTRADESALVNTRNLAVGIQSELSLVDKHLNKMLDRFEGLRNDITAHGQAINTVGITLTERSEDVGRNLTLQRQALESITSTFDTRMETLGSTIETQSLKLSDVTNVAAKNIETAQQSLIHAADKLGKTSQDTTQNIEVSVENLSANHAQLSGLSEKISDLIGALTNQQKKIKTDLAAQSNTLQDMSNMATGSTEALQENLSLGSDLLAALNTVNKSTQDAVQKRFADIENMIAQTQDRADAAAEASNARVRDSLSQTRKDLSKIETDMRVLGTQLTNAREQSLQLDLDTQNIQKSGYGRLQLKPLETDFPPVEPPRFKTAETLSNDAQAPLDFNIQPDDTPINLGADMEIVNPDDELTNFDPDVLRPAAPIGKGFGQTRNTKEKEKSGWRWRDMLGGIDRSEGAENNAAPIAGPLSTPPQGETIITQLTAVQLSPAAIVDEGTIIEASKARLKSGPATMLSIVDTRLTSPVAHLRKQFARDEAFKTTAKSFVTQYGQTIAQASSHDKSLRDSFGTSEGRAYLLCAAALS